MDPVAEIKAIYQTTTRATIGRDLKRAIELLKSIEREEERERAAVYMDGLAQMRGEWLEDRRASRRSASPRPSRSRRACGK